MDIKRQAQLISKQFNCPHAEALDLAAKLQGYEHYHAYQAKLKRVETIRDVMKQPLQCRYCGSDKDVESVARICVACLVADITSTEPPTPRSNYTVKVKALAEVKIYLDVQANSLKEAVAKAEEEFPNLDRIGKYPDWEVCYVADSHDRGFKITDVALKLGTGSEDDFMVDEDRGLQSTKVGWL